jgi:hypothetical protein
MALVMPMLTLGWHVPVLQKSMIVVGGGVLVVVVGSTVLVDVGVEPPVVVGVETVAVDDVVDAFVDAAVVVVTRHAAQASVYSFKP